MQICLNKLFIPSALFLAAAGCSSGANIIGGTDRAKTSPENQDQLPEGGTTEETSSLQTNQNNDFRGTVDSTIISAAYLACGKLDLSASEIGCNAYEPRNDERLPLESVTGVAWVVTIDGQSIDRSQINARGRSMNGLKLAMTSKLSGPTSPMPGQSHDLKVELTFNGDVLSQFHATISKLPPVAALSAFGIAQDFSASPPEPSLSGFLKNARFVREYPKSNIMCSGRFMDTVHNFCLGNQFYSVTTNCWGAVCESKEITWKAKLKDITTNKDCDAIGRIIWTELCN